MAKIPCEECLKFAMCISKITLECRDLFNHLHTSCKHYDGGTTVEVDLTGGNRNLEEQLRVQALYKKAIIGVHKNGSKIFLSYGVKVDRKGIAI